MNLNLSITPLVSLIAGILILVAPRLLNYIGRHLSHRHRRDGLARHESAAPALTDLGLTRPASGWLDEFVQVAVEHGLGVADLDVGAQILDARLVEHVAADLVAPADVGLGILQLLLGVAALAQFQFIKPDFSIAIARRGCGAASGRSGTAPRCWSAEVRDADGRIGLVDVLAAGAAGAGRCRRAGQPG